MTTLKDRLPATLATERLVLAAPTMAHAPAIAHLCNNKNVHKWMSRLPFPYTEEDARFFVEEIVPSVEELCYGMLLDDELIGVIGLTFAQGEDPVLGYWLGEPFWGHGYATEAGKAVIAAARAAGIDNLNSRALSDNARSLHVLRKLGFVQTHVGVEPIGPNAGVEATFLRLDLSR
jgi:RimJ/RimL family protein N-acetyltransferase